MRERAEPALDRHAALGYDAMSTFVNAADRGVDPTAIRLASKFYDT